ncbi:MAG: hypothetical protein ACREFY_12485, partial [Acetobacteraceae bacterium]
METTLDPPQRSRAASVLAGVALAMTDARRPAASARLHPRRINTGCVRRRTSTARSVLPATFAALAANGGDKQATENKELVPRPRPSIMETFVRHRDNNLSENCTQSGCV